MQIIRGDTKAFKFQIIDANGDPITTPMDSVYFTVKKNFKNNSAVFQITKDDMTFDEQGFYHAVITPDMTNGLDYGNYVFDIEYIISGVKKTPIVDAFTINHEVTFPINEV